MSCFSLFVSYDQAAILVIAFAKLNSLLAGCSCYLDADGRGGAGCFRGSIMSDGWHTCCALANHSFALFQ